MQNILEAQVSDLSSLVDSPIMAIPSAGNPTSSPFGMPDPVLVVQQRRQRHQAQEQEDRTQRGQSERRREGDSTDRSVRGDTREREGSGSGKRKADDGGMQNGQQRAKRNRYISIACNECKRRKIKCNGQSPCQRCGNLNLSCQYAPNCCASSFKESEEFRDITSHLTSLQQQVESLYSNMEALRRDNDRAVNGHTGESSVSMSKSPTEYRIPAKRTPKFQGPTSSAYSFDVAKNSLQSMGYSSIETGLGEGGGEAEDETPMASPPQRHAALPAWVEAQNARNDADPLQVLGREEGFRLCQVYEEEVGSMYPVLDIDQVLETCRHVYRGFDDLDKRQAAPRNGDAMSPRSLPVAEDDLNNLMMVIAIATVVEGSGESALGERLHAQVLPFFDVISHRESVSIDDIPLIALVATYHFHCDREALAWRAIGHAVRMCVELGLHGSASLFRHFPEESERQHATRIFWSVYCLDRRWSFGTGMPFAMQDADIDPQLPEPEEGLQYLKCMIGYSRLGGRVWRSVAGWEDGGELRREDIGYLDYKIIEWQKSIPAALQLPSSGLISGYVGGLTAPPPSRAIHRLQVLLFLRTQQIRILIYRPVLHSPSSILANLSYASTVVDLARDTIRALTHLNQTTDIYRVQQVCFNYFLISALAVLFLASCHAPAHFSERCKEEFYMALELVRGFSARSFVSKRLWRTIKGLKKVGPRLGLQLDGHMADEESAALAMAGMASQGVVGMGGSGFQEEGVEVDGFMMSEEMTSLFEAALGAGTGLQGGYTPGHEAEAGMQGAMAGGMMGNGLLGAGGGGMFGGEEELYRHLRDLF